MSSWGPSSLHGSHHICEHVVHKTRGNLDQVSQGLLRPMCSYSLLARGAKCYCSKVVGSKQSDMPNQPRPKTACPSGKKSSGGLKINHKWDYGTLLQLASDGIHGAGWCRSCLPSQSHPPLTVLGGACGPGPLRCAGAQFLLTAPGAARHFQGFGVNRYNQIGNGQK